MATLLDAGRTQLLCPGAEQSIGLEASPARSALSEISLECVSRREKLPTSGCSSSSSSSALNTHLDIISKKSTIDVRKRPLSILKQGNNSPQAIRARLKRRRKRRRVRFSVETKSWDGICNASGHADLDEILFRFFCVRKKITSTHILEWTSRHVPRIQALGELLVDLCNRLENLQGEGEDATIPCLPRGGGRALKVHPTDLKSLHKLHKVVNSALTTAKGKRKSLLASANKSKKLARIGSIARVMSV